MLHKQAAALPDQIRAVVSLYGAGGDLLTDWYLQEKTGTTGRLPGTRCAHCISSSTRLRAAPFLDGVPLLRNAEPFRAILDRSVSSTPPTVSFPMSNPLEPRNLLLLYLLQTGTLLDALSGRAGASASLRASPAVERAQLVREHGQDVAMVLPQLWTTHTFPPTVMLHGTADTLVKLDESRALCAQLGALGVEVTLFEIEGGGHGFDAAGNWENSPAGKDAELTRRKDEALASVLPWLLSKFN